MSRFSARLLPFVGLCFVALTGCGGGTTKVNGKVTHKGKTVVWGTVILADSNGQYHQGDIDLSGNYTIENVPTGKVTIGVTSPNPDDPRRKGAAQGGGKAKGGGLALEDPRESFLKAQGGEKAADRPSPPPGSWFALPPTAADPSSSGMSGTVEKGKPLDIDVK